MQLYKNMEDKETNIPSRKKILVSLVGLAILVLALPLTVYLTQKQQIFKPKAVARPVIFVGSGVTENNSQFYTNSLTGIKIQLISPITPPAATPTPTPSPTPSVCIKPPPPTLISPKGTVTSGETIFTWSAVPGATGYYFRITSNSTIGCGRAGDYCPGPQANTSTTYNLEPGKNYIWWVHSMYQTSDCYGNLNYANVSASSPACSASYALNPSPPEQPNTNITVTFPSIQTPNNRCLILYQDGIKQSCKLPNGVLTCYTNSGNSGLHTLQLKYGQANLYPGVDCGTALDCNSTTYQTTSSSTIQGINTTYTTSYYTTSFKISKNPLDLDNAQLQPYDSEPKLVDFTFSSTEPGTTETIFVQFIGAGGEKETRQATITYQPASVTPTPLLPQATLSDYWQGKAKWKLIKKFDQQSTGWPYGFGAGAHITAVGNEWYLFSRKLYWDRRPDYCFGNQNKSADQKSITFGTEVRKSTDKGQTWSNPVNIIVPQDNTPWECGATDGDAYYNRAENKWHYLFQCIGRDSVWNGCQLERSGSDPMGLFQQTSANPVIAGGQAKGLWGNICNNDTDDCYRIAGGNKVFDAGTFNIFDYRNGYYFVGFHGFDGVNGFRGITKTADFINWISGDPNQGVPTDAILDKNDAVNFRESWNNGSSVGFGAAGTLFDNGYYYIVSEAADISLGCVDGQNWDIGIFRSASLTNTKWEPYPLGNPILYSSKAPERNGKPISCNPAYMRLFKDPTTQTIYLHTTRESMDTNFSGIYLYQLVASTNLLKNGDLWKCNSEGWTRFPIGPTNLAIYREPNKSSDGNCFLATNCGASSCQPGQSVYQDIDVRTIPSRNVAFGGKFATESGTGTLNLVVFELDDRKSIITQHQTTLNTTTTYQEIKKTATLNSNTKTVRYQLYLDSPETFKADEMFFETQ